jgi:hypothetical protein
VLSWPRILERPFILLDCYRGLWNVDAKPEESSRFWVYL